MNDRIAQNKADLERLEEEGRRLVAESEPKLSTGDYGGQGHAQWIHIHGKTWWIHSSSQMNFSNLADAVFVKEGIKGNLSNDLKRNSEDIGEFHVKASGITSGLSASIELDNRIKLFLDGFGSWNFEISQILEIGQKLIQLAMEAKRKQNGKET